MRKSLPFALSKDRSFFDSLGDWMGDVLYDELPEKGFECRDEQIFMAYQIEQALKEKTYSLQKRVLELGKQSPIYSQLYRMHAIQGNRHLLHVLMKH